MHSEQFRMFVSKDVISLDSFMFSMENKVVEKYVGMLAEVYKGSAGLPEDVVEDVLTRAFKK